VKGNDCGSELEDSGEVGGEGTHENTGGDAGMKVLP